MGKRPFTEDQIREATGKVYHEWLVSETTIDWEEFHSFLKQMKDTTANHIAAVKRVFDWMAEDSSEIRRYMRDHGHEEFERPCHMGMNMFKLKEVLKQFEKDTHDKSNGWKRNPANYMLFYQMWTLAGAKVWKEDGEGQPSTAKRTKTSHHSEQPGESDCVVYLITNYNEYNPAGRPMRYVGRTISFDTRMQKHQQAKSGCRLMRDAIQKYGLYGNGLSVPMTTEILIAGSSEDMKWCETHYIQDYNTLHPYGYNLKAGDTAGMNRTGELVTRDGTFHMEEVGATFQLEMGKGMLEDIQQIIASKEEEKLLIQ